ncbi:MAG: polyprenyl synthetase family protein, partial [Ignavibacteria bacterium]|nr:polyprenyl synthetase family protein [Ignavibacteria bacterium]
RYVLQAGGKRVRSTLLLLACEAVGGKAATALDAGVAVELLHNFTLVHDDVMDNAESRRGQPTVHVRWDLNNAILVGDVLVGLAYESLLRTKTPKIRRVVEVFTQGLLEVCRGQAGDLELGKARWVTLAHYFRMIEKKTGSLIAISAELGGVIGGGTGRQVGALRMFGRILGRAFQLQDDLLDIVADEGHLGKKVGGDIIEGKKTFLFITAYERANPLDRDHLLQAVRPTRNGRRNRRKEQEKVSLVSALYRKYGVLEAAKDRVRKDTAAAIAALSVLPDSAARERLRWYSEVLLRRVS